jgi:Plasmid recombination enzyme
MANAIARITKLKQANLAGSEQHTDRSRTTPNADPAKQNVRLIDSSDSQSLTDLVRSRIGHQPIRKNAVLCVEMLLTASPEYFRPGEPGRAGEWQVDRLEQFQWAVQDWLTQTYGDRIVRAELHLDEATPHIHAYLVPLDERGKLNCRGLFGDRAKLSRFQDSYAKALEPLELSRGIRGSRATYTQVKEYYAAVTQSPDLTLDIAAIHHQLADRQRVLQQRDALERTARALERENAVLRQRVQQQEQMVQQLQERWATVVQEVRSLPLETVAVELGLDSDPQRPHKWRSPGFEINITDSKFYDWQALQGGGGAIDLVMHVRDCGFRAAVVWLRDRFGESATLQALTHQAQAVFEAEPVQQFMPPPADEQQWQRVRAHLTQGLRLPEGLVDQLHRQGLVYADADRRIVFLHRDLNSEAVTGATGYSIEDGEYGVAEGSRRSQGWFYVEVGNADEPMQRVICVDSPIEALSKWGLEQPGQGRSLYLAANPGMQLPLDWLQRSAAVVLACGVDKPGKALVLQIQAQVPGVLQEYPQGEGWNEDLQAVLQGGGPLKQSLRPVRRDEIER